MLGVWPAALTAGLAFAIPQFLVANFHGPWLVDIVAAISSIAAVAILLKFWRPKEQWKHPEDGIPPSAPLVQTGHSLQRVRQAWMPWILLSVLVFIWGVPLVKKTLDKISAPAFNMSGLHNRVLRTPPVVPVATPANPTKPEEAIYKLNWLSATGSGILVAAIIAGMLMGFAPVELVKTYWETLVRVRFSLVTIAAMLALGYVTRYSGTDATLGLALARTGRLYPFFGTLLGWLGVALTGSDTASNVLFGSLQTHHRRTNRAQSCPHGSRQQFRRCHGKNGRRASIVVASTATNWYGHEGSILRYVFFHSLALAILMGILVFLQAYVVPFKWMVVGDTKPGESRGLIPVPFLIVLAVVVVIDPVLLVRASTAKRGTDYDYADDN